jgi:hypothetical protein
MLFIHLRLGLSSGLFHSGFPTSNIYSCSSLPFVPHGREEERKPHQNAEIQCCQAKCLLCCNPVKDNVTECTVNESRNDRIRVRPSCPNYMAVLQNFPRIRPSKHLTPGASMFAQTLWAVLLDVRLSLRRS